MLLLYVSQFVCQDLVHFVFLYDSWINENPSKERKRSGRIFQAFYADTVYHLRWRVQNDTIQTDYLNKEPDGQ